MTTRHRNMVIKSNSLTTLKSLSMYLRAAKSDAENAGIEVDGMANSVS